MHGGHDLVKTSLMTSAALSNYEPSDEAKKQAMRNVCGANACRGASDASMLLMAMGLIPDPEVKQAPSGSGVYLSKKAQSWLNT